MPLDLKIVERDGQGRYSGTTWPRPDFVDGEYALVQRIIKNLLTEPGDDAFDPTFGSGLLSAVRGIPGNALSRAKDAVAGVLRKCVEDLRLSQPDDPDGFLLDLQLTDLRYDALSTRWEADVTVETARRRFTLAEIGA